MDDGDHPVDRNIFKSIRAPFACKLHEPGRSLALWNGVQGDRRFNSFSFARSLVTYFDFGREKEWFKLGYCPNDSKEHRDSMIANGCSPEILDVKDLGDDKEEEETTSRRHNDRVTWKVCAPTMSDRIERWFRQVVPAYYSKFYPQKNLESMTKKWTVQSVNVFGDHYILITNGLPCIQREVCMKKQHTKNPRDIKWIISTNYSTMRISCYSGKCELKTKGEQCHASRILRYSPTIPGPKENEFVDESDLFKKLEGMKITTVPPTKKQNNRNIIVDDVELVSIESTMPSDEMNSRVSIDVSALELLSGDEDDDKKQKKRTYDIYSDNNDNAYEIYDDPFDDDPFAEIIKNPPQQQKATTCFPTVLPKKNDDIIIQQEEENDMPIAPRKKFVASSCVDSGDLSSSRSSFGESSITTTSSSFDDNSSRHSSSGGSQSSSQSNNSEITGDNMFRVSDVSGNQPKKKQHKKQNKKKKTETPVELDDEPELVFSGDYVPRRGTVTRDEDPIDID